LVPLNKKYPLRELMSAVRDYLRRRGRQITFEWALLHNVNDSMRDAHELADLIGEMKASVNLIPYNPVAGLGYEAPPYPRCADFRNVLATRGIACTLRKERGQDIDAACGQLRRRTEAADN
jgi:23S rRNA (adenine2503-C2)-methyltransferase